MVMGGDSCSEGFEFDPSTVNVKDIFTFICYKNSNVLIENVKINKKEAGDGPVYKKHA